MITSDIELIKRWKKGEDKAFQLFYRRYRNRLYWYLLSLIGDKETAEDLLQDTFALFLRKLNQVKDRKNLGPYITAIARNRATDWLRRIKREKQAALDFKRASLFQNNGTENKNGLSPEEASKLLWQIPLEQRETVVMKIYLGFSFSEIAIVTEVSQNTVVSRYRYGLEKLHDLLQGGKQ